MRAHTIMWPMLARDNFLTFEVDLPYDLVYPRGGVGVPRHRCGFQSLEVARFFSLQLLLHGRTH